MGGISILVVEDSDFKRAQIVESVRAGEPTASVEEVDCIIEAKARLSEFQYDLMVLDIALPVYKNEDCIRDAGVALLREVMDYDLFVHPRYVIGITGFDDLSRLFDADFEKRFWRLLSSAEGDGWRVALTSFVRHLSRTSADRHRTSLVDLCILTALSDPELRAVLDLPWAWQKPIQLDESTYYRLGEFKTAGERTVSVAAASSLRMGPVAASIGASKFLSALRPRVIGMAGICAGVRGAAELGDVIGASEAWSWESGKLLGATGRPFAPEPVSVAVPEVVVAAMQQLQQDRAWLDAVRAEYPGVPPKHGLHLRIAPMACGAPVVADTEIVQRICDVNRKTAGIEMESFGIMSAARSWGGDRVLGFCMKSVCDFADEHKDDSSRHYAAYTSARAVSELLMRFGDTLFMQP